MPEARAQTPQQVGAWQLKSSSGPIRAYCTIDKREGGQTFGYQATRAGARYVALSSSEWRRAPGSFEAVRLTAGGAAPWSGQAAVPVPDTLVLPIKPGQRDPAPILTRAGRAQVEISGQALSFNLSGIAEALQAQQTCLTAAR